MPLATATPIFDALNAEFIEKGVKVRVLMSRRSPSWKDFIRQSDKVAEKARSDFLAKFKSDNGPAAAGKVIPIQREGNGRFAKRLNG